MAPFPARLTSEPEVIYLAAASVEAEDLLHGDLLSCWSVVLESRQIGRIQRFQWWGQDDGGPARAA